MGEGGGGRYSDPEIRGRPGLKKNFFRPFRRQFSLKIRGGRGRGCPRSATGIKVKEKKTKVVVSVFSSSTKREIRHFHVVVVQ